MTTWADLTDQLTPDQVVTLAASGGEPTELLWVARYYAADNLTQLMYAEIPDPPDCREWLSDWEENGDGTAYRCYYADRPGGVGDVAVIGQQFSDGRVERTIHIGELEFTYTQARELAATLVALVGCPHEKCPPASPLRGIL